MFWLDGHYSAGNTAKGEKDTPLVEELTAIVNHSVKRHIILIDDARLFGRGGYPAVEWIEHFVGSRLEDYKCDVLHDVVRLRPSIFA